uniref:ubiquitinyl hydrolase 1 n=1 Tax=Daphnia galeata TaxID=27404 RepID=A0A8J2W2D7_9CRUS|nr:unnamed protein product [Daphnia galeata]
MSEKIPNIEECLEVLTSIEQLGADSWALWEQLLLLSSFMPKVLVIHLKRSLQDQLDMLVEFPTRKLNMNPYVMDPNKKDLVYDLIGVCNHYGTLDGGQYTACARHKEDGFWYYFDDSFLDLDRSDKKVNMDGEKVNRPSFEICIIGLLSERVGEGYERCSSTIQEKLVLMPSLSVDRPTFEAAFLTRHQQEQQMTRHRLETYWNNYFPTIMAKEMAADSVVGLQESCYPHGERESLKQFLSIKEVYEAILLSFQSNNVTSPSNNHYFDVWDGHYTKEHNYNIEHSGRILCFQSYMDEFEAANPLGNDLVLLRDGLSFNIRNEERIWFGILLHFIGDMPASNFVGACVTNRNASEISQPAKDTMSSNYGINRRSPFDRLGYFDSTKCFMHDLMHVVPEGVLNDCSALLLQYLILDPVIKLNLVDVIAKF